MAAQSGRLRAECRWHTGVAAAPDARGNPELQRFLLNNSAFLSGTVPSTVYSVSPDAVSRPEQARRAKTEADAKTAAAAPASAVARKAPVPGAERTQSLPAPAPVQADAAAADRAQEKEKEAQTRNVMPQRVVQENAPVLSQIVPATADFRALTSDEPEGALTRYVQDRLEIVFWLRPPQSPG
jgi:hypothetical protein